LYSRTDVEVRDSFVRTSLDKNYEEAILEVITAEKNLENKEGGNHAVEIDLYSINERV